MSSGLVQMLDLCRLCLVKDRVGVPIFEDEGDVRQVFLKIAACLPVKVSREDKLPKKICDDCMYKLELFYQFWNTTANAEKQLLQWLGEVEMEDKQGYVTGVLNPSVMKQEQHQQQQASENSRLDGGSVMQQQQQVVASHQQQSMGGMGMIENMAGLGMPIIISTANQQQQQQQQITSVVVPMDTSGGASSVVQTVQGLPGPSTHSSHDQITQNQVAPSVPGGGGGGQHHEEDEDSSEDEENESDDECDGDDGLPVKEEGEEDPNNRTVEPTTFVNVSLACDEAGPSGLQQQKITEMPEMTMPQVASADNKTGDQPTSLIKIEYHIEDSYVDDRSEIAEDAETPIKIVLNTLKEEYPQPGLKIHRVENLKLQKNFDFYEEEMRLQKKRCKDDQYLASKFERKKTAPIFLQSDKFQNFECDCYFCDTIFKTSFDFENHLSSFRNKYSSKMSAREIRENLQCDLCKTFFITKCGLRNHAVIFHENISCNLHCHKCQNRYKLTGDFLAHMKECEESRRRRCKKPVRKVVSNFKNRLKCYICKKSFVNQTRLSRHVEKHLISEKKSKLRELSHKMYTFSCKDCKVLFSTKFLLLNHMAKNHNELIGKAKCPECKKKCKSRRGLAIHMGRMHGFTANDDI